MQSVVIVTAALGNKYILPSTSPATYQRFHDFPFLLRLCVYTLYLTLPVKLEVCSPKTLFPTTHIQWELPVLPSLGCLLHPLLFVVPSFTLHSSLLPRFPRYLLPPQHFLLFGCSFRVPSVDSLPSFLSEISAYLGFFLGPLLTLQGILAPSPTHTSRLDFLMQSEKDGV